MDGNTRIIGTGRPIHDAKLKVTGEIRYTGDMKLPGMLHGKMILSTVAHGRVVSIDTAEAEKLPGVEAIVTCFDTPDKPYNSEMRFIDHEIPRTETVFSRVVRHVGDRIGAVAATDPLIAEQAVRLIKVEYEERPAVFDVREALREGAVQLHEGVVPNAVGEIRQDRGDVDRGFAEADVVYEDEYETPVVAQMAMENHVSIAQYDSRGKLTLHTSTQNVNGVRNVLSYVFDLPMSRVRVIKPPLGGAFGSKIPAVLEPVAAALAMKAHKPVKVELKRKDNFIATKTRHGAVVRVKTGVMKDGTIVAHEIDVLLNTGAYVASGLNVAMAMSHKGFKPFKIPNMRFRAVPVLTNLPNAGAMRGYGSPQLFAPQQMQFHKIAGELGLDMNDFLVKNLLEPDETTYDPTGNPRPIDCVVKGRELFGWDDKKKAIEDAGNDGEIRRGIGMALGCHGNGVFGAHRDFIGFVLKMNDDGTFNLMTGTHDMGNALVTSQLMAIAEELGVMPEDIEPVEADTDVTPWNLGDYSSRGIFVTTNAAIRVAQAMKERIFEAAAGLFEVSAQDLQLGEGGTVRTADGRSATFSEVLVHAHKVFQKDLVVESSYASEAGRTSYGAHFAEVEVNMATGKVTVLDYAAVHDVGQAINRLSLEGQLEGGIQMGLGYALSESMDFDDKGKLKNSTLKKYKMFKASDMPPIKTLFIEEYEPTGPYGGKSIGECATVPSAPAVANAVAHALGRALHTIPVRPDMIRSLTDK